MYVFASPIPSKFLNIFQSDNDIFREKDFYPSSVLKEPPSEKPPPPPPTTSQSTDAMVQSVQKKLQQAKINKVDDDEIDRQEREIIASLEMEEREHKRYMELKGLYKNSSFEDRLVQ